VEERIAKAGVAVFIVNELKQILLGVRISKPGYGHNEWQLAGGKLTHMEDWIDCCKREVLEETDLTIDDIHFITARNNIYPDLDIHFVTCFFVARKFSGEPKVMEVDKCFQWKWFDLDNLPEPLFLPIKEIVSKNYNTIIGD